MLVNPITDSLFYVYKTEMIKYHKILKAKSKLSIFPVK